MKEKKDDFSYCFKKAAGLKLIDSNSNLVEVYKRKSRSALHMLSASKEKEENEWILETSYYAKYFMVYSLFMKSGIKSEIHDCTIFALKSLFVDLGIVSQDLYEDVSRSRELRIGSLYYDKDFGKEVILNVANTAPDFCLKMESIIDHLSQDDSVKIRETFEKLKKRST
ncbi:MAG TPA: hypothetical protein VJK51_03055 [Candidatus Nanoarchaeia archaeon]|nr:hypothetical protein [Candidatus Nanoarchaeia archaeon]